MSRWMGVSLSVAFGVCLIGWWVLSPLRDRIAQNQRDIAGLAERLAELNQVPLPEKHSTVETPVAVSAGVQRLLQTAREQGVRLSVLESPPAPTPREGIHVTGVASLPAFLGWLHALAAAQPTFFLKRESFRAQTDGSLAFSVYALPVAGLAPSHIEPMPVGNPFCHAYGLSQALAMARLPLLQRYPLRDETFLGLITSGWVKRALVQVPGGRLEAVGIGGWVGEERARVVTMTDHALGLRWPDGRNDVMKREGVDDA